MIENITREQFEGWLAQFGDDEKAGISQHGILCPFANCLKALHPEYLFVANHYFIVVSCRNADPLELEQRWGRLQTVSWQRQLMVALDTGQGNPQPSADPGRTGQDITAGTVRKVLEQIKSESS